MRYLQVREDGIITDCITYPFEGYVEFEGETPSPCHGGWHKLVDGVIVEIVELNPTTIENQIQSAIDQYTQELIDGGLL